ncbi:MAG TPA: four-helix bundle copper-binding protein, partial [Acidimicrobiia bacterium]|nr:four-helix bundle copper-binding protein [Acidimicrobiia bacterium]
RCITLNQSCADICSATGRTLTRHYGFHANLSRVMVEVCREACRECARACEAHAHHHEHCRVCAEVCRRTEAACDAFLAAVRAPLAR